MNKYVNFMKFRNDVEEALADIAKQYGLNIKAGNISYDENEFKLQLKCERSDIDVTKTKFAQDLLYMKRFGFTEDDYKREVVISNKKHIITGFKPGNKYDVCTEREDGKKYAHVHTAVIEALGRTA